MPNIVPIEWLGDRVRILDQTKLPQEERYVEMDDYREVADAIRKLRVRGAPAIGVAGAYAIALGAMKIKSMNRDEFLKQFLLKQKTATLRDFLLRLLFLLFEHHLNFLSRDNHSLFHLFLKELYLNLHYSL